MYREKPSHEVMDISYRLLKNHKQRPSIRSPSGFLLRSRYTVFFHSWTNINIILKNCHAWSLATSYLALFPLLTFPSKSSYLFSIYSNLFNPCLLALIFYSSLKLYNFLVLKYLQIQLDWIFYDLSSTFRI